MTGLAEDSRRTLVLRLKPWALAARPKTLFAAVTPVILGGALAYDAGFLHGPSTISALAGAILIQIGTNYANDYFDFIKGADTSGRVGPARATASGDVTPDAMRRAMSAVFALALVPGAYIIYRGGWPFAVIGLAGIASGILYTGGPYPLGYVGLGDLFVFVFFGPVAVGGTYYLQGLTLDAVAIAAGCAPGLLSVAILTVNNLRDREQDAAAGKRTLAVRFGATFARVEYTACLIVSLLVIPVGLVMYTSAHYWALASLVALLMAWPLLRTVWTGDGAPLNLALADTGRVLFIFGILFSIGWNL